MRNIYNKNVNNINEFNLLHDILNNYKRTKISILVITLCYMDVQIYVEV